MNMDVTEQLRVVKEECYKLSQLVGVQRMRVEYNKNNKINDKGKLDLITIYHCYSS